MTGVKVQDCDTLDYRPEAHMEAGQFVGINDAAGFLLVETEAGELGAIEPLGGKGSIWRVNKAAGDSFTAGSKVFYDTALSAAIDHSTSNTYLIGYAIPTDGIWTVDSTPVTVAEAGDTEVTVYTGYIFSN